MHALCLYYHHHILILCLCCRLIGTLFFLSCVYPFKKAIREHERELLLSLLNSNAAKGHI